MSKTTIRKLFVGSLIALAGGLVLLAAAGGLAYASSSFVKNGPDVVGIHATPFGWVMIGLAGVHVLADLSHDHVSRHGGDARARYLAPAGPDDGPGDDAVSGDG